MPASMESSVQTMYTYYLDETAFRQNDVVTSRSHKSCSKGAYESLSEGECAVGRVLRVHIGGARGGGGAGEQRSNRGSCGHGHVERDHRHGAAARAKASGCPHLRVGSDRGRCEISRRDEYGGA